MNSEPGIGQFPPFWPIGFCVCFALALCAKRISADHAQEKGKKKSAGAEKKERPPKRATTLKRICVETSRKAKP